MLRTYQESNPDLLALKFKALLRANHYAVAANANYLIDDLLLSDILQSRNQWFNRVVNGKIRKSFFTAGMFLLLNKNSLSLKPENFPRRCFLTRLA